MNRRFLGEGPRYGGRWSWGLFLQTFALLVLATAAVANCVWSIGFQPSRAELREFEARVRSYVNERAYVVPRSVSLQETPNGTWY